MSAVYEHEAEIEITDEELNYLDSILEDKTIGNVEFLSIFQNVVGLDAVTMCLYGARLVVVPVVRSRLRAGRDAN